MMASEGYLNQGGRTAPSLLMPALTKKEELSEDYLSSLKRKDLLNLCKEFGIKCVGKNTELIEKLLEHCHDNATSTHTPHNLVEPPVISATPMTPQKSTLNFDLPIVNTPGSPAIIKSIVQSARKTGLNSSPIRVPFALSPMAAKLQDSRIQFMSPMKSLTIVAKEPSQPIREAFLSGEKDRNEDDDDNESGIISIPFESKRPFEESEAEDEDLDSGEVDVSHQDKKEKLDKDDKEVGESQDTQAEPETVADINQTPSHPEPNTSIEFDQYIVNEKIDYSASISDDSSLQESDHQSDSVAPSCPPSNFSTDLLTNLRDPEFSSPELVSAIDARVSRSEHQDQKVVVGDGASDSNNDKHRSRGNNNPLLPSGIIKLLEKKRQERDSNSNHPKDPLTNNPSSSASSQNSHSTFTANPKKKFDLKESLKRPLTYKPHIGSLKPKKEF